MCFFLHTLVVEILALFFEKITQLLSFLICQKNPQKFRNYLLKQDYYRIQKTALRVSKFQKQIFLFLFEPKKNEIVGRLERIKSCVIFSKNVAKISTTSVYSQKALNIVLWFSTPSILYCNHCALWLSSFCQEYVWRKKIVSEHVVALLLDPEIIWF